MTTDDDRMLYLAAQSWSAALDEDYTTALRVVQILIREQGGGGLGGAMCAWCDTAILTAFPDWLLAVGRVGPARLSFARADRPGEITDVDGVAASAAWAGRIVNARWAWDKDTWLALCGVLTTLDDADLTEHISVLLNVTANMARGHGGVIVGNRARLS